MTRGPGSEEGFREARHWQNETGPPNKAQRAWMYERVKEHVDPAKRPEVRAWIANRRRSRLDMQQLCKRWGIEFPDDLK